MYVERSLQYDRFLEEQQVHLGFYERAAKWAYGFVGWDMKAPSVDKDMEEAEFAIRFRDAFCLAIMGGLMTLPLSVLVFLVGGSSITNWVAAGLPFIVFGGLVYYPSYAAKLRKLKMLGQSPLAILYLVIAMEVTPNLEASVAFAAKNMPNPMGLVFKHLLWMTETRAMPDMEEAFNWYSRKVKEWAPHLAEALYLIAGSMREVGAMRRRSLEKATAVVLEGTKGVMETFARSLDIPVMATNAFGIMLPVLLLIIGPIASVFASSTNVGMALLVIYDFLIPLLLLFITIYILGKRPGSISEIEYLKPSFRVTFMGREWNAKPLMILIAGIFGALQVFLLVTQPTAIMPVVQGVEAVSVGYTLPGIVALGVPLGIYFLSWAQENQKIKKRVETLEREFGNALYQLGNIMNEGVPIEEAMQDVADRMKGSETEVFFRTATNRVRTLGWPLERALFDEKYGVLREFPSNLIRNIMLVLMKSAEKGPRSASLTSISVSNYLKAMQDVRDKIIDLLSESISGLRFQGMVLIPLITGTIVGLGQITSNLLMKIASQISGVVGSGMASGYGYIGEFINIQGVIQPSFLQMIVGVYVVATLFIIGLLVGGLEDGWERTAIYLNIGKLISYGVFIYALATIAIATIFGNMIAVVMI
ncbi:MAG TPA: hypothetical protein ENN60_02150 [archaeon]|nr:hypothetical protein [archaeon]